MVNQPRSGGWSRNPKDATGSDRQQDAIGVLPLRVLVPLTDWKDRYSIAPWMVRIEPDATNGLSKSSAADAFQIRSRSLERLTNRIGRVSDKALREILKAVQIVIGG